MAGIEIRFWFSSLSFVVERENLGVIIRFMFCAIGILLGLVYHVM